MAERRYALRTGLLTTRQPTGIVDQSLFDLGMESRHALVVEWHLTADENVENNAKAPYINLGSGVSSGLQQFWGSKIKTAAECFQVSTRRKKVAETKINDLDVASLADEYVLNLEIAMDDTVSVAVIQGARNLTTELSCLLLLKFPMRDDVVEHLTPIDVLEEHVPMIIGAHNISHAANVGMIQEGNDGCLARRSYFFGLIGSFLVRAGLVFFGRATGHNFARDL